MKAAVLTFLVFTLSILTGIGSTGNGSVEKTNPPTGDAKPNLQKDQSFGKVDPVRRRYEKTIRQATGQLFSEAIKRQVEELDLGTVEIKFTIDQHGKLRELDVIKNTSNALLSDLVKQVIREAKFEPPPAQLLNKNGVFVYPMTFHLR